MNWHYHPVILDDGSVQLAEVYTHGDRITGYCDPGCIPMGDDLPDLCAELERMLSDARYHKPMTLAELEARCVHLTLKELMEEDNE